MSGVYIRGMEIPERCGKCRFATAFDCLVTKNFITTFNEQLYLAEVVTDYINQNEYLSRHDMRTLAQLRDNYVCADSPIGEYRCQVEIRFSAQSERKSFSVDTCLQHEIHELIFKHKVNTIGCCCGHGRKQAYIQVSEQL